MLICNNQIKINLEATFRKKNPKTLYQITK